MNDIQDRLHELMSADPFIPFRIIMSSGRNYDVSSPYMIATGKSLVFYCYPKSNRTATLPASDFSSIETMEIHDDRKKR